MNLKRLLEEKRNQRCIQRELFAKCNPPSRPTNRPPSQARPDLRGALKTVLGLDKRRFGVTVSCNGLPLVDPGTIGTRWQEYSSPRTCSLACRNHISFQCLD